MSEEPDERAASALGAVDESDTILRGEIIAQPHKIGAADAETFYRAQPEKMNSDQASIRRKKRLTSPMCGGFEAS